MAKIELPDSNQNAERFCNHLKAYAAGYSGMPYDMNFLKDAAINHVLSPDKKIVERAASNCWIYKVQPPHYFISCCFNLAGLQDQAAGHDKGKWLECLTDITKTSAMAYTDQTEERTATLHTLNTLAELASDPVYFKDKLAMNADKMADAFKARYGVPTNT